MPFVKRLQNATLRLAACNIGQPSHIEFVMCRTVAMAELATLSNERHSVLQFTSDAALYRLGVSAHLLEWAPRVLVVFLLQVTTLRAVKPSSRGGGGSGDGKKGRTTSPRSAGTDLVLARLLKFNPKTSKLVLHDWIAAPSLSEYDGKLCVCRWDGDATTWLPNEKGVLAKYKGECSVWCACVCVLCDSLPLTNPHLQAPGSCTRRRSVCCQTI